VQAKPQTCSRIVKKNDRAMGKRYSQEKEAIKKGTASQVIKKRDTNKKASQLIANETAF
jgi:hypothetical protein